MNRDKESLSGQVPHQQSRRAGALISRIHADLMVVVDTADEAFSYIVSELEKVY